MDSGRAQTVLQIIFEVINVPRSEWKQVEIYSSVNCDCYPSPQAECSHVTWLAVNIIGVALASLTSVSL